ncbi:hypothetical protein Tco_0034438 [Tanacetum coccineum]
MVTLLIFSMIALGSSLGIDVGLGGIDFSYSNDPPCCKYYICQYKVQYDGNCISCTRESPAYYCFDGVNTLGSTSFLPLVLVIVVAIVGVAVVVVAAGAVVEKAVTFPSMLRRASKISLNSTVLFLRPSIPFSYVDMVDGDCISLRLEGVEEDDVVGERKSFWKKEFLMFLRYDNGGGLGDFSV